MRERALIGLGFAGRAWGVALLVGAWGVASAVREVRPELATACLVGLLGVGGFGVALPALRGRWAQAGDARRQARRVERLSPGLRGRLVTLAERVGGRVPVGESGAVLDRMATRALPLVEATPPGRVHPVWGMLTAAAGLGGLTLALLIAALLAGPRDVWAYWGRLGPDGVAPVVEAPTDVGEVAKVGDLVLRYVYPSYTGLEPREIENSTGEAHGPPGTLVEVRLRSASVVDSAAIVVDMDEPLPAVVAGEGRVVVGSFTIGANSGMWRVQTVVAGAAAASREFAIVSEPDLPPEVVLEGDDAIEVAVNQPIPLGWRVRDDFGVRRVTILLGGVPTEPPLLEPRERQAEVNGSGLPSPFALGLRAGDRVKLVVAGWDNDEVSGSKIGVSRTIDVKVLGADATDRDVEDRQRALRDVLVDLLSPFVVERWPPTPRTASGYAAWGADVAGRLGPLQAFVEKQYGERLPGGPEGEAIERVSRAGNMIVGFTQTAFAKGGATPPTADVATAKSLREKAIATIENQVLALDYFIQRQAWERLEKEARALRDVAERMKREVEDAKSPAQLTELLERTEAAAADLKRDVGDLGDTHMRDRVEPRADELVALGEEARAALKSGRFQEAKELARRQSSQAGQLGQQIVDEMERRQQRDREAQERRESLEKELQEIQDAERSLAAKTAELARSDDAGAAARMEKLWKSLADRADRHERMSNGASELAQRFQEPVQQRLASAGQQQSRGLKDQVANQDLDAAREQLEALEETWQNAERPDLASDARQMQATLDEVQRLSDKISPQTRQATQRLAEAQRALSDRGQKAGEAARKVAQELPTRPEGIEEGMNAANEAMGRSGEHLKRGAPTPAQGAEQTAVDGIQQALDALRQAMEAMQPQDDDSEGGGDERATAEQMRIPSPELFRTPEQYRRELLEGMEGEVPDEYRALKKRYYEELVNQ